MTATVVRYQAKPDRADENQQLIEAVFADLDASSDPRVSPTRCSGSRTA